MNLIKLFSLWCVIALTFLGGCAVQAPTKDLTASFTGNFNVTESSGDNLGLKRLQVSLDGQSGVIRLLELHLGQSGDDLKLTNCVELGTGPSDPSLWRSSFLDGQDADVIRCVALGYGFKEYFAMARAASGTLNYHPPIMTRIRSGVKDIQSTQGWIIFFWNPASTTAYAVEKQ
jgi:hypothetical protein